MRSPGPSLWLCLALAACDPAPPPAPTPRPAPPAPRTEAELLQLLQGNTLATGERLALLRGWLDRPANRPLTPGRLRLQLRLAALLLLDGDADAARTGFEQVFRDAPRTEHDLRGRARYGIAQAQELAGDLDGARATLAAVVEDFDGTRYADFARSATARLAAARSVRIGAALPPLRLGLDALGRPRDSRALADHPFLLVFFDVAFPASVQRLEQWAKAWQAQGQPPSALLAYAVQDGKEQLGQFAEHCDFPVLPSPEGFLHPDWLALGVTGVPACFLVGADGTLLARDLPPERLAELLRNGNR